MRCSLKCTRARAWFEAERILRQTARLRIALDLRYIGQNFELEVVLDGHAWDERPCVPTVDTLRHSFFALHERTYGFHNPLAPVEVVACRVSASGDRHLLPPAKPLAEGASFGVATATRPVWFDATAPIETAIYRREHLARGQALRGPAIIEQMDTTILVAPGDHGRVDDFGNLVIEVGQ